jgi:hypothetical protein
MCLVSVWYHIGVSLVFIGIFLVSVLIAFCLCAKRVLDVAKFSTFFAVSTPWVEKNSPVGGFMHRVVHGGCGEVSVYCGGIRSGFSEINFNKSIACVINQKPSSRRFFCVYRLSTAYPELMHSPVLCGQLWDRRWKTLESLVYHRLWLIVVQTQYLVVGEFFSLGFRVRSNLEIE